MDTIIDSWSSYDRIGNNTPTLTPIYFKEMEEYIQHKSLSIGLVAKFNVDHLVGGIPPKGDKTDIITDNFVGIGYHDVLGGLKLSTRNAEINSRIIDYILAKENLNPNTPTINFMDKYVLRKNINEYEKIIFLPGSNLFNTIDWDKIDEILLDNPTAVIKTHPITNPESIRFLENLYGCDKLIVDTNAAELIGSTTLIWSSYNSEIGLIAAHKKIPLGNISKWSDAFKHIYSPIYRHFKYKNVIHNKEIVDKIIFSDESGFIFPSQYDWRIRIDNWFDNLSRFKKGLRYPYSA